MLRLFRGIDTSETTRLEAFSDGVIAIAITLLVLDVHVPDFSDSADGRHLWRALGDLWPSYVGYVLSFATIGILWANHHTIFRFITAVNHQLVVLNTAFLFFVSFLPFPTALLAEYLGHDGERTATIVYTGWFLLIALIFNAVWFYARWAGLVDQDTHPVVVNSIVRRFRFGPPAYALAFVVAFISPGAALAISGGLALLYVLPQTDESV